jgi:hypothetical protein
MKISFINSNEKIGGIRDRQGTHGDVGFSGLAPAAAGEDDDGDEAADVVLLAEPQATAVTAAAPRRRGGRAGVTGTSPARLADKNECQAHPSFIRQRRYRACQNIAAQFLKYLVRAG